MASDQAIQRISVAPGMHARVMNSEAAKHLHGDQVICLTSPPGP